MKTEKREEGVWISAALLHTAELSDTEKILIALIDGDTSGYRTCELSDEDIARKMCLTQSRSDAMLKSLTDRHYVFEFWPTHSFTCRVVHPDVSEKPGVVDRWIKEWRNEACPEEEDDALFELFTN